MKIGKIILWLVLIVIALGVIGFFVKTDYHVERSIVVDASSDDVMAELGSFETFVQWSPWSGLDSSMVSEFQGEPGTVGHFYSWKGNENVGSGSMEITEVTENGYTMALDFIEPFEDHATTGFTVQTTDGGTEVTWWMNGETPILFSVLMDMENIIGADYEKGLQQLQTYMSNRAPSFTIGEVQHVEFPARTYLVYREEISWGEMDDFFNEHLPATYEYAMENGLEMTSAPSGLYFTWDEENERTDMAIGMGVSGELSELGAFSMVTIEGGAALKITFKGPYEYSGNAHYAMEEYLQANGIEAISPVVEEYVNDPAEVEPSEITTDIYYLLK